jgi:hypothetical protein
MNRLELDTKRTTRMMLIGLLIALFAFGALGIANPRSVHADYPSERLQFACLHSGPPNHPDNVYVQGYNQYGTWVEHQFPSYYTYDNGFWWWMEGSYVYYYATYHRIPYQRETGWVYHVNGGYLTILSNAC